MTTTPNLPGPERIRSLRNHLEFLGSSGIACAADPCPLCAEIRDILDALPALQAEVDRLRAENAALSGTAELMIDEADNLKAELAAARPLIEAAEKVDKELAIKTLNRLYHPMFQEKGRPVSVPIFDTIMPLLEAIPDCQRTERAPAGHEEEPKQYRCEGCGKFFDEKISSHARAVDDGHGNPIPVECGPIVEVKEKAND